MGTELRLPNITGATEREQLSQMRSYLYQLVEQLQFALNDNSLASRSVIQTDKSSGQNPVATDVDAVVTFSAIKALIIKSADIVNAYYDEITTRLEGKYVAESDFGSFAEHTEQLINQSSMDIEQLFTNLQVLVTGIDNINFTLAEVNAYIRSGLLCTDDDGVPVYGLEIGQENTIDGEKVFEKFARFTADRLSFYDQNGTELAYISDYKLYIRNVEIKESFQEGGYKDFITAGGGVITRWVGGV